MDSRDTLEDNVSVLRDSVVLKGNVPGVKTV